ncbi:cyclase family protein [Salinibacter ruber]|uniref:Kynurenine formamidase n=1 Tax=Salinibacter ruber TaxID=146919 RepID=A0A9X2QAT7_9BACT|nr:cyclase family protein [Salinibacter ruber]MCS3662067.1 arylformamidase [Salinibacter ruber]MCS3711878.1 arylformamidase [Salinibacter ruber]
MSDLIDISVTIGEDLPIWPGSPGFRLEALERMDEGDEANVSQLTCDVHTGTHIDAPRHFVDDGKTVDQIPLDALVGLVLVARVPDEIDTITAEVLNDLGIPNETDRLLLHTQNSTLWSRYPASFQQDYVALSPDAARWVVDHGIRCLGVDYLSVQHYDDGPETHQILLEGSVVIIEGLNLSSVPAGWWELCCLPVKLEEAEAALARAALRPLTV